MKLRLGAIVAVVVAALLIVPPLLGRVSASSAKAEIIMQLDNATAIQGGKMQEIAGEDGTALFPVKLQGRTLLPLRWFAEAIGLTVEWDNVSKSATLTDEKNKDTEIVFSIDNPKMMVGEEAMTLDSPATLVNGVTYVPLRAIGEACGWNIHYVDDAAGALIFLNQAKKTAEPTDKQITAALEQLGPSRAQLLADGVIGRAGSGTMIISGSRIEVKDGEGAYQSAFSEGSINYLPIEGTMLALGGGSAAAEEGGYTLSDEERSVHIETGKIDGKAVEGDNYKLYVDENQVAYASVELLAAALQMQYTTSGDAFALTAQPIATFPDKEAYLLSLASQLPDKRPDIPDAQAYVALTFDDGPTGKAGGLTEKLLDGLQERGAHATFFMCGYRVKDFNTNMNRYLAEGHELGNHSMNHPMKPILAKMSVDGIYEEVVSNSDLIKSYTGEGTTVMRPVGGTVSENLKQAMAKAGQPVINWSVDTLDWKYRDAARIKNVIVNQAKDGDIVLMHDLHQPTVDGALAAIDELQEQGYAFVTVSELAQIKGIEMQPGTVYTGFGTTKGYEG